LEERSRRLRLVAATLDSVRGEIGDHSVLSRVLGAAVPAEWPPEMVRDALPQFVQWHEDHPDWVGWLAWYAIRLDTVAPVVCGSVGFMGPPDTDGVVEIGYSVLPAHQSLGLATEMVMTLLRWAWTTGRARCVVAQTTRDNRPSIRVLQHAGFTLATADDETGALRYRLLRP
jgi:ribosomal-protein-alanine N-acetyltransferase